MGFGYVGSYQSGGSLMRYRGGPALLVIGTFVLVPGILLTAMGYAAPNSDHSMHLYQLRITGPICLALGALLIILGVVCKSLAEVNSHQVVPTIQYYPYGIPWRTPLVPGPPGDGLSTTTVTTSMYEQSLPPVNMPRFPVILFASPYGPPIPNQPIISGDTMRHDSLVPPAPPPPYDLTSYLVKAHRSHQHTDSPQDLPSTTDTNHRDTSM